MRFITFERDGAERLGVRDGDMVVDLSKAAPDLPQDLISLIEYGMNSGLKQ